MSPVLIMHGLGTTCLHIFHQIPGIQLVIMRIDGAYSGCVIMPSNLTFLTGD